MLAGLLVLMALVALLEGLAVGLAGDLARRFAPNTTIADVRRSLSILTGVFVLKNVAGATLLVAQHSYFLALQEAFSTKLLQGYVTQDWTRAVQRNSAEYVRNVGFGVPHVFSQVLLPLSTIVVELSVLGILVGIVARISLPGLIVASILFTAGYVGFHLAFGRRAALAARAQHDAGAAMLRWTNEAIGAMKESRIAGVHAFFVDGYRKSACEYANSARFHRVMSELPRLVIELLAVTGMLAVVAAVEVGGHGSENLLTVVGVFAIASLRAMPAGNRIAYSLATIRHHLPALREVTEDLATGGDRPEIDRNAGTESEGGQGRVLFDRVSFSYPSGQMALRDLSFSLAYGEMVGIVGSSGSGKTTLVDVLLGLHKPASGSVVDGSAGRRGYVPQEVFLRDASILENVALGVPVEDIDEERVWRALRAAQMEEHVRHRPLGIRDVVGERGQNLSGGQRQRLGIARALYFQPRVLVLDEATSSLDPATEAEILRLVSSLKAEMTIVFACHRESVMRACDRLLVLSEGRIVDQGTFAQLESRCEEFRSLIAREAA